MFVEIHMLQNFAPSNLNRDDTGSPKDCIFGGYRRARISSQCFKRAIRLSSAFREAVGQASVGTRTRRLPLELAEKIQEAGVEAELAQKAADVVFKGLGFKVEKEHRTSVALYVSPSERDALFDAVVAEKEAIVGLASKNSPKPADVPAAVKNAMKAVEKKDRAADIAMFGRMVAEDTHLQIDASCQVAHAISTHATQAEMDFYTAVDDLNPKEDHGAAMMGFTEFQSACFYRYATVDVAEVTRSLGGDAQLAASATVGFFRGAVAAIPSGKQNSHAAHNQPALVWLRVRAEGAQVSLVNAFQRPVPVSPRRPDLVENSMIALLNHERALAAMYGEPSCAVDKIASLVPLDDPRANARVPELFTLLQDTLEDTN